MGVGVVNPVGSPIAVGLGELDELGVGVGVGVAASATSVPIKRANIIPNAEIIPKGKRFNPLVGVWRLGWNTAQA